MFWVKGVCESTHVACSQKMGQYTILILANYTTDKCLIFKIYKQLIQLNNNKKLKQSNQKMGRRPKQTFLRRRHTEDQQAHEKMLIIANY